MTSFLSALIASTAMLAEENIEREDPKPKNPYSRMSIIVSGLSYHMKDDTYRTKNNERKPVNNLNLGLGFEYRLNRHLHANAGFYENSNDLTSFYVAGGVETNGEKFFGAGADAGLVTGYKDKPIPIIMPYLRLGQRNSFGTLQIMVLPPIVATANIRINLNRKDQKGK